MTPDSPVSSLSEDDYQPLRALNDLLYCERRCALHRVEMVWVENVFTLEGTAAHSRAHRQPTAEELGAAGRIVRGMWLRSERLAMVGVADVVEFRPRPVGPRPLGSSDVRSEVPYPIEYKRGKRRKWDNDDVQLCAQALCLEEMLAVEVPAGAIYHARSHRRREVVFDAPLREKTEAAVRRLHELIRSGVTPPAVEKPQCQGCSLHQVCLPELLSSPARATRYSAGLYSIEETV